MAPLSPSIAISPITKPVGSSENVKVTVAVSPAFRAVSLKATVTVGAVVSTLKLLLAATPSCVSVASLPAASFKVPELRLISPAGTLIPSASVRPASIV